MIKIIENYNRDSIDRTCFKDSVNYWVSKGYKVLTVAVLPKEDKIMAVLDNNNEVW